MPLCTTFFAFFSSPWCHQCLAMDNAYDLCRIRSSRTAVSVHQRVVPHQSPCRIKAVGAAPGGEATRPLARCAPENRRYPAVSRWSTTLCCLVAARWSSQMMWLTGCSLVQPLVSGNSGQSDISSRPLKRVPSARRTGVSSTGGVGYLVRREQCARFREDVSQDDK
jgi:hypothetical protein